MPGAVDPVGRTPRARGQALAEFAIVIPVFMLALVAVFDAGRAVYTNSVLSQAAREGARLGAAEVAWIGLSGSGCVADASAIGAGNPGAHVCPATVADFKADVVEAVNRMAVSVGPLSAVYVSCNSGSGSDPVPGGAWIEAPGGGNGCQDGAGNAVAARGDLVSVRVVHTYQPITPIIGSLIGSPTLSGSASMEVN
jgi:hypothetical protein